MLTPKYRRKAKLPGFESSRVGNSPFIKKSADRVKKESSVSQIEKQKAQLNESKFKQKKVGEKRKINVQIALKFPMNRGKEVKKGLHSQESNKIEVSNFRSSSAKESKPVKSTPKSGSKKNSLQEHLLKQKKLKLNSVNYNIKNSPRFSPTPKSKNQASKNLEGFWKKYSTDKTRKVFTNQELERKVSNAVEYDGKSPVNQKFLKRGRINRNAGKILVGSKVRGRVTKPVFAQKFPSETGSFVKTLAGKSESMVVTSPDLVRSKIQCVKVEKGERDLDKQTSNLNNFSSFRKDSLEEDSSILVQQESKIVGKGLTSENQNLSRKVGGAPAEVRNEMSRGSGQKRTHKINLSQNRSSKSKLNENENKMQLRATSSQLTRTRSNFAKPKARKEYKFGKNVTESGPRIIKRNRSVAIGCSKGFLSYVSPPHAKNVEIKARKYGGHKKEEDSKMVNKAQDFEEMGSLERKKKRIGNIKASRVKREKERQIEMRGSDSVQRSNVERCNVVEPLAQPEKLGEIKMSGPDRSKFSNLGGKHSRSFKLLWRVNNTPGRKENDVKTFTRSRTAFTSPEPQMCGGRKVQKKGRDWKLGESAGCQIEAKGTDSEVNQRENVIVYQRSGVNRKNKETIEERVSEEDKESPRVTQEEERGQLLPTSNNEVIYLGVGDLDSFRFTREYN